MLRYFISFSLLSSERPSYDHFLAILYHRLLLPHFIQSFQKRRYWPTWNRFRPASTVVRDSRWCFPYHSVTTEPGWWWRGKKEEEKRSAQHQATTFTSIDSSCCVCVCRFVLIGPGNDSELITQCTIRPWKGGSESHFSPAPRVWPCRVNR